MPGVSVTTTTRSGPTAPNTQPSGQVFMVGMAERGRTTGPVLLRGFADYEAEFGGRTTYSHLYDNIQTFFEEGGSQAWVTRVVGPSATTGTVVITDRQTPAEPCITLNAASPGAWSSSLSVVIADSSSITTATVKLSGVTVETFSGASAAELIGAMGASAYLTVDDEGSDGVAPANKPLAGTYTLSAGTDDRSNVLTAHYTTALATFDLSLGDGAVAIPGIGSTVHATLIDHAEANRRIALLSEGETASTATLAATAGGLNSEYAGLFAPWIQIATPTGTRFTSPEGYVAGVRNRAHTEVGPWRAPAGQIAVSRSVIGLKYDYSRATGDGLDANKVSAIRTVNNTVRLYGWRSLSNDTANYSLLVGREVLNRVVTESESRLEEYIFEPIDGRGQLLSSVNGTLVGILEPMRAAGGLYELLNANGDVVDNGYKVDTGSSVNSLTNLANNEVRARVSLRVSPSAALISVTITKVGLLSNL